MVAARAGLCASGGAGGEQGRGVSLRDGQTPGDPAGVIQADPGCPDVTC